MQPRMSMIAFSVGDLAKSVDFYENGFPKNGVPSRNGVFHIEWRLACMAGNPRPRKAPPFQRKEAGLIALPHNLGSETEGDNVFNQAVSIGVAVKKPQKIWGYSGYFKNPDGKLRIIRFFRLAQKTEDNRKFFNEVSPPLTFE